MLFDFTGTHNLYFMGKASAVTAGFIAIFVAALYKHKDKPYFMNTRPGTYIRVLKYAAFLIPYFYLMLWVEYITLDADHLNWQSSEFISFSIIICISAVYGYLVQYKETLRDIFMDIFAIILFSIAVLACLMTNLVDNSRLSEGIPFVPMYIIYNALAVFALFRLLIVSAKKTKVNFQLVPLSLSIFTLIITIQTLLVQANLPLNSMIISFVLILAALALIVAGFRFKFPYVRRFGLGLEIASIVKFFIMDLYFLSAGSRIISYFVLGGVLIGISFVYQQFSKKVFGDIGTVNPPDAVQPNIIQEEENHETQDI